MNLPDIVFLGHRLQKQSILFGICFSDGIVMTSHGFRKTYAYEFCFFFFSFCYKKIHGDVLDHDDPQLMEYISKGF